MTITISITKIGLIIPLIGIIAGIVGAFIQADPAHLRPWKILVGLAVILVCLLFILYILVMADSDGALGFGAVPTRTANPKMQPVRTLVTMTGFDTNTP
jgi:uncharacterized membrane protein YhaH (DUF805 family)